MSSFLDKNVLVTGGAGEIGGRLARKALDAGASNLVIWDIDTLGLAEIEKELKEAPGTIQTYSIDLTETDQITNTAYKVLNEIGPIDILINNAGIVIGKLFKDYSHREIDRVIFLNVLGFMHTTRAFLPAMLDMGAGHIVNISSAASLLANPRMSVYAGSKWAVTGWSESLRLEMESLDEETDVHITTVQPGYIRSKMFEGVNAPLLTPLLDPDKITDNIMEAIYKNKNTVREPFLVKLIPLLKGLLPAKMFDFLAGKILRVYSSMETFTGRKKHISND